MAGGSPFKMVSTARPKESLNPKTIGKVSQTPYSYEHRITLDNDMLDKLGQPIPQVGDKYHVMGHGEVTSVNQNADEGGKTGRVEIQLQRLGVRKKGGSLNSGMKDALNSGISEAAQND